MAKKSISSWKQKKVYEIVAPDYFDSKLLGETLSADPTKIIGRTISVSVKDLIGDRTKQHITLVFEASNVSGLRVHTKFKAFEISYAYLKSRVRKGMKKISYIGDLSLADKTVRIKVMVAAGKSTTVANKKAINSEIKKTLEAHKPDTIDKFVQAVVFGKAGTEIYHKVKKITPVSRVEIQEVRVTGS